MTNAVSLVQEAAMLAALAAQSRHAPRSLIIRAQEETGKAHVSRTPPKPLGLRVCP